MKEPARKIKITRTPGKYVEVNLHLKWETGMIGPELERELFEGLGIALAAAASALSPSEHAELIEQFRKQAEKPAPTKRQREESFGE